MGIFSSIGSFVGGVISKGESAVRSVAGVAGGLANKVDQIIPHPKNGGFENIVNVLAAPFSGEHVTANVSNPILKRSLEIISNNPLATAGVAAGGVTAVRAIASSGGVSGIASAAKTGFDRKGIVSAAQSVKQAGIPGTQSMTGIPTPVGSQSAPAVAHASRSPRKRWASTKHHVKHHKKSHAKHHVKHHKKHYGSSKQYSRKGGKTVHKTKNGQPYIILASGKARFIKKSRR